MNRYPNPVVIGNINHVGGDGGRRNPFAILSLQVITQATPLEDGETLVLIFCENDGVGKYPTCFLVVTKQELPLEYGSCILKNGIFCDTEGEPISQYACEEVQ